MNLQKILEAINVEDTMAEYQDVTLVHYSGKLLFSGLAKDAADAINIPSAWSVVSIVRQEVKDKSIPEWNRPLVITII